MGAPSTGQWYFVIAWHDSSANTVNIQVNNGTVDSTATTGIPQDDNAPFEIGRDYSTRYWNGRIDGVGFWKKVLTAEERTALYNSGNGDDYPFTVGPEADTTGPTVTAFTIPETSLSLTVSITAFTATDNVAVSAYKLTETETAPGANDAGWTGTAPSSYTFSSTGTKTLYAWAKDAAGNVSSSLNDSVIVSLPVSINNKMVAKPTSNSVTILVKTNITSDITIDYGITTGYGSTATSANATIHEVLISSLNPSTTYHYRITASENSNASNTTSTSDSIFKTQLEAGNSFTVGIIGDMQSCNISNTITQVENLNPDIILTTGDNVAGEYATTVSDFQSRWKVDVFDYIQNVTNHIPLFTTLGNHDAAISNFNNGISAYQLEVSMPTSDTGGEKYYSFDYGDAHIVVLNGTYSGSNAGTIDSTQLTWLQNDLQSTSKKYKFVFDHFLVYGVDNTGMTSTWRLSNYTDVHNVLKNNGVLAYFNGHRHVYNRYVKDGVFYISNLSSGIGCLLNGIYGDDNYANSGGDAGTITNAMGDYLGFTKLSVSPSRASVVIYKNDGTTIDSFDLTPTNFELNTPSNNGYTNDTTPTFTWNASTDNASGLAKYQLYIDGSLVKDNISSAVTTVDATTALLAGAHTWYLKAVNNAGWNTQSTSTYTINIDTVAPALSSKTTFSGWYNSNQTSTFTYTDSESGIASGTPVTCNITTEGSAQSCSVTPNVCDAAGNCNTTLVTSNGANIDKTAPTISAVSSIPTSTGATVTWTTNENSSSKIDYGLTNSYGSTTAETDTATRVQSHSVVLSSLSTCTTYHYRVRSIDTALNETIDSDNTFVTTGCASSSSSSSTSSSTSTSSCGDQTPGAKAPWLYGAIAQDSGSVLLYFTEADNPVNKYVLEYGTKTGDYPYGVQDMGVNSRGQMTFLVKSLSSNTTYYFRVRGGNGCATGSWSNEISATTKGLVSFNQLEITQSQLETQPVIEIPSDTNCQTYTVKFGDTLWSIAKNLLGDGNKYKDIIEQNKDKYSSLNDSNNISIGWELKINCGSQTTKEIQKTTEAPVQGGYDVKVKVIDTSKKPIEGATVTLHSTPQTTKTDKNGVASFSNVEAGDHKVLIAYNNFEGEQSINLTGDVKEFDLNVTVQQKAISLSPLAYGIIGIMGLVIIVLVVLLIKNKRKE